MGEVTAQKPHLNLHTVHLELRASFYVEFSTKIWHREPITHLANTIYKMIKERFMKSLIKQRKGQLGKVFSEHNKLQLRA